MAKGRFISNSICLDKVVNDLDDPWSILAFTWLVTHADREGRTYGDPAIVRSKVFPRRTDVTIDQIERYIKAWHDAGLIVLYEADGDKFIYFPGFEKNQVGLQKERETPSIIPDPTLEVIQSNARVMQDEITVKLIEENTNIKSNNNKKIITENNADSLPNRTPEIETYLKTISDKLEQPYKNHTQIKKVLSFRDDFDDKIIYQAVEWAAEKGMTMGNTISALSKALPNWGRASPKKDANPFKALLEREE